jgi:hypothetical protein
LARRRNRASPPVGKQQRGIDGRITARNVSSLVWSKILKTANWTAGNSAKPLNRRRRLRRGEAAKAQATRGFKMIGINHISYSCSDYAKARDFYAARFPGGLSIRERAKAERLVWKTFATAASTAST